MAESPHHVNLINEDGSWKHTNALIHETSPYLRQHAHNPVDWKPWGQAAFDEASERDVPIFLSIGYSTCYWCHVMERQVFENPTIARQMNQQFVCLKVDREERPDVDDIYMAATQLLTGSGGWPMSVFLTPYGSSPEGDARKARGLLPFWAGTYIPPEPAYGRPSFPQVMDAMSQAWKEQREEVLDQSTRVADAVLQQVAVGASQDGPVLREVVTKAVAQLMQRYDAEHGGFSGPEGPKFPTPSTTALLLDVYQAESAGQRDEQLGQAIQHTLDRMARGGMYDQVGGGFHRYSVDEKWLVPHFEKMLYDNGQLLSLYAAAYHVWQDQPQAELYERVMRETADYLLREMLDDSSEAGGALWSAQDAEVNTKEGENYVWTAEQVRDALTDEPDAQALAQLALKMYGLDRGTNFTDPHHPGAEPVNVLFMPDPLSKLAGAVEGDSKRVAHERQRINAALLKVRDTRDQPGTDDKVLVAWNGLAIAGLAEVGQVLDEPRYIEAAQAAADTILQHMSQDDGGLFRSMRNGKVKIPAFLEDYAFLAGGLLALDRALPGQPNSSRYFAEAKRLMAYAQSHFANPGGGYHDTLADQADLFVRTRSTYDGALPSGNSQMIHNLVLMGAGAGEEDDLRQASKDLRSFFRPLEQSGLGMTHMLRAAWGLHMHGGLDSERLVQAEGVKDGTESGLNHAALTASVEKLEGAPLSYRVVLEIAEGYHLNANPASAEGLIATALSAAGVEVEVHYPAGVSRQYAFTDDSISVYEGRVELLVQTSAAVEAFTLTYQACTDEACLAPQALRIIVP